MKITDTDIYAKACEDEGQPYLEQHDTLEDAWNACTRINWLIWALRAAGVADDEKQLRLFACWCVRETPLTDGRKAWDLLTDERSRSAVEVAERYAHGEATDSELDAADAAAQDAARDAAYTDAWAAAWAAAYTAADAAARAAAWAAASDAASYAAARNASYAAARAAAWAAARDAQATQFRVMFSCPFKGNNIAKDTK